ncbi:sigma-70 family RNA polymerase sigma factor [Undibacterium sp. JH2W]|uniref:sigma-70 family RNA polymerase sigma factor n=1 Tax=Undibacterium sp. JH2W TaxID=3413037 RepID=UPI003BF2494A
MESNAILDVHVHEPKAMEGEDELWKNWHSNADLDARERLIAWYMPYAKTVAASMYSRRYANDVEFAEYFQIALLGMFEAMNRYKPGLGTRFTSFSGPRMRGAILNSMENHSEKYQQITVRQRLNAQRLEASKEMAAPANLNDKNKGEEDQIFRRLAEVSLGLALSWLLEDSGMVENEDRKFQIQPVYESLELKQLQEQIRVLVDQLSRQEEKVIRYHYLQLIPFEEIAEILNLSRGRISQIHRSALKNLKQLLAAQRHCDLAC